MGSKRKTFSAAFKAKVAIEAIREEKSPEHLSRQLRELAQASVWGWLFHSVDERTANHQF